MDNAAELRSIAVLAFAKDATGFVAILQPFWAILPSPEVRAVWLSGATLPFRADGRCSNVVSNGRAGAQEPLQHQRQ